MFEVLQKHGVQVCGQKSWGRQMGDTVFEFRVDRSQKIKIKDAKGREREKTLKVVLRLFCHGYGDKKILVLNGYDKGEDPSKSTQQRELALAKSRLREWKARQ